MLLSKTVRSSSTLKLAFIYVIAFCAAIFGLLGYVYWSTVTYLHEISDRAISRECVLLTKAYEAGGQDGLVAFIDRRLTDPFFNDWFYLLVDPSLNYVSGNLQSWPTSLPGHDGWTTVVPVDWQPEAAKRPRVRVTPSLSTMIRRVVFDPRCRGRHIDVAPFGGTDRSDQRDEPKNHAKRARRAHTVARDR